MELKPTAAISAPDRADADEIDRKTGLTNFADSVIRSPPHHLQLHRRHSRFRATGPASAPVRFDANNGNRPTTAVFRSIVVCTSRTTSMRQNMSAWQRLRRLATGKSVTFGRNSCPRRHAGSAIFVASAVEQLEDRMLLSAAIATDKADYSPGQTAIVQGSGFAVLRKDVKSDSPKDTVIDTSPGPGTLQPPGTTITVTVSKGPTTSTVPDVTTLSQNDAQATLKASGFAVKIVSQPVTDASQDGIVQTQDPPGGSKQPAGTPVTIAVVHIIAAARIIEAVVPTPIGLVAITIAVARIAISIIGTVVAAADTQRDAAIAIVRGAGA